MQAPHTLEVRKLHAAYRRHAVLHGLDLPPLAGGELVALVGPNAAGKSTLLRALARLIPANGSARWAGQELLGMSAIERARTIGYMPQHLPHNVGLNVLESILTAMQAQRLTEAAMRQHAMEVLERLELTALALHPLHQLSGGQRQMAALAQALACDAPLLLLDEPTSALDLRHQWQVMQTIRLLADEGRLVIAVLHDLALAAQWADRLVVLHEGMLHACARPRDAITTATLRQVYSVHAQVYAERDASRADRLQIVVRDVVA